MRRSTGFAIRISNFKLRYYPKLSQLGERDTLKLQRRHTSKWVPVVRDGARVGLGIDDVDRRVDRIQALHEPA